MLYVNCSCVNDSRQLSRSNELVEIEVLEKTCERLFSLNQLVNIKNIRDSIVIQNQHDTASFTFMSRASLFFKIQCHHYTEYYSINTNSSCFIYKQA